MAKMKYDQIVDDLRQKRSSLRLSTLKQHLTTLGFDVQRANSGNHHTFTHPEIPDFHGSNFDGGHGADPEIKKSYVSKIIKFLQMYEEELKAIGY